jgi:hypothetical protein
LTEGFTESRQIRAAQSDGQIVNVRAVDHFTSRVKYRQLVGAFLQRGY